jgi:inosine-uridine nucleoside N-ribohydrolase
MERAARILLLLHVVQVSTLLCQDPQRITAPRPVIIDTDIGSDIDDSFAIGFALQSSQCLDVKLIVTCTDDTTARAKIVGKLLTIAGMDSTPIGVGYANGNKTDHTLWDWAKDFNLSDYRGGVFEDGVDQMAKIILSSETVVDIIAIGPMTNFPLLLQKYPDVVKKARIRAMAGSIYRGYDNSTTPTEEYNVKICPECMQELLTAGWNVSITPLDTCGVATLPPQFSEPLISSTNLWSSGLTSSLLYFCTVVPCQLDVATSPLYDTVATLLALPSAGDYVDFKMLNLTVTDDGYTVIDNQAGVLTQVALYWKDNTVGLDKYRRFLVDMLSV